MGALTVKLPPPLEAKLDALVRQRGGTRSELVREAIERLIAEAGGDPLSVYDLASDLCGVVKDGPTDLSTNPKHMEGFGECRSRRSWTCP